MKTMPAGEFKARCLSVMEQVKKYRTPVVITKKGRPVAKLIPADGPPADVFGCMAGTSRITGDVEAPRIVMEAGAVLDGQCRMTIDKPAEAPHSAVVVPIKG